MAKKPKYYVVWQGKRTGVFRSWEECKLQVIGFAGAKFKSFDSIEAAEEAYDKGYEEYAAEKATNLTENPMAESSSLLFADIPESHRPILPCLAVDAACSGNPGKMEYRGVVLINDKVQPIEVFHSPIYEQGTNNIGEFLAIVDGIKMIQEHQVSIPLYSDSKIAQTWIQRKLCETKLPRNERNQSLFQQIDYAEQWLHDNSFNTEILKWDTDNWGEIPADFGRK